MDAITRKSTPSFILSEMHWLEKLDAVSDSLHPAMFKHVLFNLNIRHHESAALQSAECDSHYQWSFVCSSDPHKPTKADKINLMFWSFCKGSGKNEHLKWQQT